MKLWVQEDVLGDWTEGIVCVLAESEEDAWEILKKKDRRAWEWLRGWFEDRDDPRTLDEIDQDRRFRCVESPEAFVVYGGG